MCFLCISTPGGRLRGMMNTGQQLYWVADIPKGLNPSRLMESATFLGSLALPSLCISLNIFHASPSEGVGQHQIPVFICSTSNSISVPCHLFCCFFKHVKPLKS